MVMASLFVLQRQLGGAHQQYSVARYTQKRLLAYFYRIRRFAYCEQFLPHAWLTASLQCCVFYLRRLRLLREQEELKAVHHPRSICRMDRQHSFAFYTHHRLGMNSSLAGLPTLSDLARTGSH